MEGVDDQFEKEKTPSDHEGEEQSELEQSEDEILYKPPKKRRRGSEDDEQDMETPIMKRLTKRIIMENNSDIEVVTDQYQSRKKELKEKKPRKRGVQRMNAITTESAIDQSSETNQTGNKTVELLSDNYSVAQNRPKRKSTANYK